MPLNVVLDPKLLIISGKGGVGKTTMAAALAILAARHGKNVLVAEVEGKNLLSELFDAEPLTPEPLQLAHNLYGMNISPEEALEEYFQVQFHMKRIAKPLVGSQLVDYVTHAAPGLKDLLMLGKVWYHATKVGRFDTIVLDTPAAGHAVSMLRSPEGFLHAVPIGPLANHTKQVLNWLKDFDQVAIHLTSMAEEMPVNETIETTALLEEKLGMNVSTVLVNMLYPPLADDPVLAKRIEKLKTRDQVMALDSSVDTDEADQLIALTSFYKARRKVQQGHRKELSDALKHTAKIVELPYVFSERFGKPELEFLADEIERQLGA